MSGVDVVVPCYNYARFLPRCVESLLDQPGVDVRVLIIDDCSSDDTPVVGAQLAARDPRIEFRRHEKNLGHIATYNEGLLGWVRQKYCLLISADDAVAPGSLSRAASLMDADDSIGMTYGMAVFFSTDQDIAPGAAREAGEIPPHQLIPSETFLRRCCAVGNPVPTPTAVVRTALQHEVGGYSPELPHSADMEMWMEFAVRGPIAVLNYPQAYYRVHGTNMSNQYHSRWTNDRREQLETATRVFARWGTKVPQSRNWLDAMTRRFGDEALGIASNAFDLGNLDAYRQCVDAAFEFDPSLRHSKAWRKLRTKRMMGPELWRHLRPAVNRLRGLKDSNLWELETSRPMQVGRQFGWWPQVS
jgi:glycosyltransferase involved in cell wall biosynthesis